MQLRNQPSFALRTLLIPLHIPLCDLQLQRRRLESPLVQRVVFPSFCFLHFVRLRSALRGNLRKAVLVEDLEGCDGWRKEEARRRMRGEAERHIRQALRLSSRSPEPSLDFLKAAHCEIATQRVSEYR